MMALTLATFWNSSFHFSLEPIIWSICNSSCLEANIIFTACFLFWELRIPPWLQLIHHFCVELWPHLYLHSLLWWSSYFWLQTGKINHRKLEFQGKRTFHVSSCCCYETGRLFCVWLFYFYQGMLSAMLYVLSEYKSVYSWCSKTSKTTVNYKAQEWWL